MDATGLVKINIEESGALNALGGAPTARLQFAPSGPLYSIDIELDASKADLKYIQSALEKKYGKGQAVTSGALKRNGTITYGMDSGTLVMFASKPVDGVASLHYFSQPHVDEVARFVKARAEEAAKSDFDRLVDKI